MCDDLPPVWFDATAAKAALPEVSAAISKMAQPRPAATRIYYASLAIAAGDPDTARKALAGVGNGNPRLAQLQLILKAQQEVASGSPGESVSQLEKLDSELAPANRPLALYWLGMAKVAREENAVRLAGVLDLLHLPAVYGESSPALAAAALYQSMQTLEELGDLRGSIAVRSELLSKYGQTYHAAKLTADN